MRKVKYFLWEGVQSPFGANAGLTDRLDRECLWSYWKPVCGHFGSILWDLEYHFGAFCFAKNFQEFFKGEGRVFRGGVGLKHVSRRVFHS